MDNKTFEYIENTSKKQWKLFDHIYLYIKDSIPDHINIESVKNRLEKTIPWYYTEDVDDIFIGYFPELETKKVNASFKDGAIYLTNDQENEDDIVDDIVHEISHAVEEKYKNFIYDDKELLKEFLLKRHMLYRQLKSLDIENDLSVFNNINYDVNFDKFLLYDIGYDRLNILTNSYFISPYSITSIREYFAIGFESYYLEADYLNIRTICPALYKKLQELDSLVRGEE